MFLPDVTAACATYDERVTERVGSDDHLLATENVLESVFGTKLWSTKHTIKKLKHRHI